MTTWIKFLGLFAPITAIAPICIRTAPSPSTHHIFCLGLLIATPSAMDELWPIDPTVKKCRYFHTVLSLDTSMTNSLSKPAKTYPCRRSVNKWAVHLHGFPARSCGPTVIPVDSTRKINYESGQLRMGLPLSFTLPSSPWNTLSPARTWTIVSAK